MFYFMNKKHIYTHQSVVNTNNYEATNEATYNYIKSMEEPMRLSKIC